MIQVAYSSTLSDSIYGSSWLHAVLSAIYLLRKGFDLDLFNTLES